MRRPASRSNELHQYFQEVYGRSRAALCSTVTQYSAKGALRDVDSALDLPGENDRATVVGCLGLVGRGFRTPGQETQRRRL